MISSFSQEQFQQFYEFSGGGVGGEITEKYPSFKQHNTKSGNFHRIFSGTVSTVLRIFWGGGDNRKVPCFLLLNNTTQRVETFVVDH